MIPLRDENPTQKTPVVTVALILANIVVFGYEFTLPREALESLIFAWGVIPAAFTTHPLRAPGPPALLTLFSSMFLHGGFLHLAGNMLYLWVFGDNIEEATGHVRFLFFYLVSGLVAAFTQIATSPGSQVPMVGASGAIAGVLGAYMVLYPHARVLTLVPIFIIIRILYLPAAILLGLWFLLQILLSAMTDPDRGGVALFAHIGGFLAGMILIWPLRSRRRPRGGAPRRVPADRPPGF